MDAVALQHVKKSYTSYSSEIVITGQTRQSRTRQVLRDLSVRFPIGQLTVIVGRSGCGKSTLLKLLAGKEQPDAGQIDMPQGWHSALLSPDPYVITWTNVQRNVAMACGVGKTPEERYEKAADFVRLVGLQDYADLTPAELKERGYAGMDYRNTILKANEHWVAEAHALGLEVNVWTVNTREEMEYFLNLGVDYITTDEPELLQALIRERSGK